MIDRLIGQLRQHIVRPVVFFPLVAGFAVLAVYGVIEIGLAMTGRWERDLMRRMEYYRDHQPNGAGDPVRGAPAGRARRA